ncbi:MAG: ClbS/DfsB family four-helix bundle protein [Chloroflexota bacterium]
MTDEPIYPKTKEELFAKIEEEWAALMDVVAKLGAKQLSTPDAGGWTPTDNLAHLTEWMNILLGYHMDKRPAHEVMGVAPEVVEGWDFDKINAVLVERNKNRSAEDVLDELKTVYARVMDRLKSTPFEKLLQPRHPDDPQSYPLLASVAGDTYEHFAEHREAIEKATAGGDHK